MAARGTAAGGASRQQPNIGGSRHTAPRLQAERARGRGTDGRTDGEGGRGGGRGRGGRQRQIESLHSESLRVTASHCLRRAARARPSPSESTRAVTPPSSHAPHPAASLSATRGCNVVGCGVRGAWPGGPATVDRDLPGGASGRQQRISRAGPEPGRCGRCCGFCSGRRRWDRR